VTGAPPLRYEVLGPLRAWRGDQPLALGPAKQRAVLAVLLLAGNRPVSSTAIVDAVWGDAPPDNGANVVQKYVGALRRVLEPDRAPRSPAGLLPLTDAGYQLSVEAGCLDADEFGAQVRQAQALRSEDPESAAARLRSALALWQGEVVAGLTGPVFDSARVRLADSRAGGWELWAELELELGRHAGLVPELLRLVQEFPGRERLRALLMLTLYRSGRQADALSAYRDAHRYLSDELGIVPGEPLRRLHQQLLAADPALPGPSLPQATTTRAVTAARAAVAAQSAAAQAAAEAGPAVDPPRAVPPADPPRADPPADPPRADPTPAPEPAALPAAVPAARPYGAPPGVDPYAIPAGSYAPPDPWAPPRYGTPESAGPQQPPAWMRRAPALLVPLATFGFLTFVVISYLSIRRRSWGNLAAGIGYLALTVLALSLPSGEPHRTDGILAAALLTNMFGGALHGWLLSGRRLQSDRAAGSARR
jgi:SARP family transcriptional regulator, regulator of embCAB operon